MSFPPFPFEIPEADVPILGLPIQVTAWFPTVALVCKCAANKPVLIMGFSRVSTCPACGTGFELNGVQHDVRTGKPPHFEIKIIMQKPPAATPPNGSSSS